MEITNYDNIDAAILRELQKDGRATITDLSERVGLSASPVARRLHNLEEAGFIIGYAALLDEVKLAYQYLCRFNSTNRLMVPLPRSRLR
jgi:Lrp/AsnC family leucine-responsive transcriptional regulator